MFATIGLVSAERAGDKRTVDRLNSGPECNGLVVLQYCSSVAVSAAVGRTGVENVSFPLAPGASGWLPALADIPKFKCAPRWSNETIENVTNTLGNKLALFGNMI
jgi:hypothetical protein